MPEAVSTTTSALGAAARTARERGEPVRCRASRGRAGRAPAASPGRRATASSPSEASPTTPKPLPASSVAEGVPGQRMVVHDQDAGLMSKAHRQEVGLPIRGTWPRGTRNAYEAWLSGELLLFGLLGAALALFVDYPRSATPGRLPGAPARPRHGDHARRRHRRGAHRDPVLGRRTALRPPPLVRVLRRGGATLLFEIVPVLDGAAAARVEAWAAIFGALVATGLIALAPFVRGVVVARQRRSANAVGVAALALAGIWMQMRALGPHLPPLVPGPSTQVTRRAARDRRLAAAGAAEPRRADRFRAALPQPRRRPRPLARVGGDAQPLLRALPRVPAADAERRPSRSATSSA